MIVKLSDEGLIGCSREITIETSINRYCNHITANYTSTNFVKVQIITDVLCFMIKTSENLETKMNYFLTRIDDRTINLWRRIKMKNMY